MGIVLLASLLLAVYDVTLAIPNNHPIEFTTDGPPIFATNSGVPNYIVGIALGPGECNQVCSSLQQHPS